MTIWLISYTARGRALGARVADILRAEGHGCRTFALPKFCEAGDEALALSAADCPKGDTPDVALDRTGLCGLQ